MPTQFVKGDFLVEAPVIDGKRVFACPVDVSGKTDAGIASAVAKRWPEFGEWWSTQARSTQLGDARAWTSGQDVLYALAIVRAGSRAKVTWLERAVRAMLTDAQKSNVQRINVPRLWGGATGLDGDRAKRVLDEVAMPSPVSLVVFEQFIRAAEPVAAAEPILAAEPVADGAPPKKKRTATTKKAAPKKKTAAGPKKKTATAKTKKKAAAAPKKKAAAKKNTTTTPKKKATAKKTTPKKKTAKKTTAAPKKKTAAKKTTSR